MAGITPHDRIGKNSAQARYKKKEEEEEAVVTCVWMLANKEKLLLSRNPRKQTLDVIASAKQARTSLTEPLLSLFSVLSWFSS